MISYYDGDLNFFLKNDKTSETIDEREVRRSIEPLKNFRGGLIFDIEFNKYS